MKVAGFVQSISVKTTSSILTTPTYSSPVFAFGLDTTVSTGTEMPFVASRYKDTKFSTLDLISVGAL